MLVRRGTRTGAQLQLVRQVEALGSRVTVTQLNVTVAKEAAAMLHSANDVAPVEAIFHLAMYLDDRLLPNQVTLSIEF